MERELLMIGSTCVDCVIPVGRLPKTGDDIQPPYQTFAIGGTGWNACRAAILAGTKPTFLSPVGVGMYAEQVEAAFAEYGVEVMARSERENGCCYCLVEEDGERTFMCIRGGEYEFRKEWLDALPGDYALAYTCGMEIQDTPAGENIMDWLEAHPETEVFYAPGPRGILMTKERQMRMLNMKPIVHLNEHEILALTGEETQEAGALALHKITGNIVIVTLGGKGCLCVDKGGKVLYAEGRKVKVADTIGAGDSHAGTMLGCLYKGMGLVEAMKLANAVAAEVVSKEGAQIPRNLNFMEE
ncbi:MAG: carbohydrate kinase family protein [Oscillospiraceae bacterium]|nr:carbohydrate kinase family protein [Oscillospiraceae bacterium]